MAALDVWAVRADVADYCLAVVGRNWLSENLALMPVDPMSTSPAWVRRRPGIDECSLSRHQTARRSIERFSGPNPRVAMLS